MVRQLKDVKVSEPRQENAVKRFVPNFLSVIRILMTIPIIMLIEKNPGDQTLWLFVPISIAIISDILDGHLARRWRSVSRTGLILDPLGDKILTLAITIRLLVFWRIKYWLAVMLIVRDVLIMAGCGLMTLRGKAIPPSNKTGKFTTIVIAALLTALIFNVKPLIAPLEILTAILISTSFIFYVVVFFKNFLRVRTGGDTPNGR